MQDGRTALQIAEEKEHTLSITGAQATKKESISSHSEDTAAESITRAVPTDSQKEHAIASRLELER